MTTLRILVFSTLFPSPAQPTAGVFIRERMFRVALSVPYYRSRAFRRWVERTGAAGIRKARAFSGPMAQYFDAPGRPWLLSRLCRREGEQLFAFERQYSWRAHLWRLEALLAGGAT